MQKRQIVKIDESKCNGCGQCIIKCAEGALQIVNGKAKLISDKYCDGLGACLGACPEGAITIEERIAEKFDEIAVEEHLKEMKQEEKEIEKHLNLEEEETDELPCGCPGSMAREIKKKGKTEKVVRQEAELTNWPVQLKLVPIVAEHYDNADLLITADCVPFAYPNFHSDFLRGKPLIIGCPKLDDYEFYKDKLMQIFKKNKIKSITIVHMEVPCCFGLVQLIEQSLKESGKIIPIKETVISVEGERLP